ncbi:outer membrane lipoprotein carrier protein LolA [Shewanella aestuarii]|uniref:Outer membrane lipoprotein carrier protein LolA n=1 Tax=Shewanella aestuarii TaxID=1028752 RepID=A0A6G9QHE7_9GAMM|nr:outer membrane lipoprotein carrier protein LolA [Shewanella aestuarii]QIR13299.1 outer membrane lipoprotein carrier protein LolA [Shewanella aestuarii]
MTSFLNRRLQSKFVRALTTFNLVIALIIIGQAQAKTAPMLEPEFVSSLFQQLATEKDLQYLNQYAQLNQQYTQGKFIQTRYLAVLKKPLKSMGEFSFHPSIGMLWQQKTPFETTMVMQQNKISQFDSKGELQQQTQSEQSDNPLASQIPALLQAMLSGDLLTLQQDFNLYYDNQETEIENPSWSLGLVAKDDYLRQALGYLVIQGNIQINRILMLRELPSNRGSSSNKGQNDITDIQFSELNSLAFSTQQQAWFDAATQGMTP